ncbi:MAG TPA: ATP-binding protein [Candidatus Sulfotelmatobacter sp.]|nr:ATP-binding protein [Candidatus Sulfotelmatobacter sp.]
MTGSHPSAILCCRSDGTRLCAEGTAALLRDRNHPIAQCPRSGLQTDCSTQPTVTVLTGIDHDLIVHGLNHHHGSVEQLGDSLLSGGNLPETLRRDGLYLGLSTSAAYGVEVAKLFTQALRTRLGFSEDMRDNLELALHEALVNGLIHGNLGIPSTGRDTLEMFTAYCHSVERGLADPVRGLRLIEIFAWWDDQAIELSVVDQGEGFDPAIVEREAAKPGKASGRGLQLIGSLSEGYVTSEGGRRLSMRFRR